MNNIPPKLRAEMVSDYEYSTCLRHRVLLDHMCQPDPISGKLIEWEHVITFAGRQLQKKWAIIPICWLVHRGGKLDKEINEWISLNRATDDELREVSKATDYIHKRTHLNRKYGTPKY